MAHDGHRFIITMLNWPRLNGFRVGNSLLARSTVLCSIHSVDWLHAFVLARVEGLYHLPNAMIMITTLRFPFSRWREQPPKTRTGAKI